MNFPMMMRHIKNDFVVKFIGITEGTVVMSNYVRIRVGDYSNCWVSCTNNKLWEPYPITGHPLLNPDSPHYKMVGGIEAIELMEKMFTREELMAWAKLTAMKYRLRIGAKDSADKEIAKIKTYEDYYNYLEAQK